MITDYKTKKGVRKQFDKYITLNMKEIMYADLVKFSNKNGETMSDFIRRAVGKEISISK